MLTEKNAKRARPIPTEVTHTWHSIVDDRCDLDMLPPLRRTTRMGGPAEKAIASVLAELEKERGRSSIRPSPDP